MTVELANSLLLLGYDFIFDFVIRGLRDYLSRNELCFVCVWPALDNLLGIGVSDAGEGFQLLGRGRIDVDQVSSGSRFIGVRLLCFRSTGLWRLRRGKYR